MAILRRSIRVFFLVSFLCIGVGAELHRAKTVKTKSLGHDSKNHGTFGKHSFETWAYSIGSAILVGLSGIFPLLVIPLEAGESLKHGEPAAKLKLMLSFAVGGLLGDVFLHLLPEAWMHVEGNSHEAQLRIGLWVLVGILSFLVIEKFTNGIKDGGEEPTVSADKLTDSSASSDAEYAHGDTSKQNGTVKNRKKRKSSKGESNGTVNGTKHKHRNQGKRKEGTVPSGDDKSEILVSGWLNLLANVIDNFTHGLAVAGSYTLGIRSGMITTVIILLHEIPHEIGDFAILLKAGFNRWKAGKAQLLTATGGVIGAITGLAAESAQEAGNRTAWILPFTSGGFIYISLVTVVPDLVKETNPRNSLKQVLLICLGIAVMASIAIFLEDH